MKTARMLWRTSMAGAAAMIFLTGSAGAQSEASPQNDGRRVILIEGIIPAELLGQAGYKNQFRSQVFQAGDLINLKPARILGMFDINGSGTPDASPDSDGDGLPDSWEVGGLDAANTDVPFPAPDAIVPGTPAVSIFSRRPVRTSATSRDSDGDGLTDFVEVFGLKFIDDNGNGILDDACARDAAGNVLFNADGTPVRLTCSALAAGEVFRLDNLGDLVQTLPPDCDPALLALDPRLDQIGEWYDFNGDGMPSIGEYPAHNILVPGCTDCFDFDGFVFTDPTNPDTDGDGLPDGIDNDPLINPRSFGIVIEEGRPAFFYTADSGPLADDIDADNDGLGNGMDLGNDLARLVDNPQDLQAVLRLFRRDLLGQAQIRVSEGLIEDLLGADWNGDGLFRLTDVLNPRFGLTQSPSLTAGAIDLFRIEDPDNPARNIPLGHAIVRGADGQLLNGFPANFNRNTYYRLDQRGEGGVNVPLPFQELLVPSRRNENVFLPDPRIWTVLYSWRMPGFDIDGNGFIGFDGQSFAGDVFVNDQPLTDLTAQNAPTSEHIVPGTGGAGGGADFGLDGVVQPCGIFGLFSLTPFAILGWRRIRHRRNKEVAN